MRCLKRNMTEFEYYPYSGAESDLNDDGEHTGEYYPLYDDMVQYKGNISSPSGRTNQMFYGEDIHYTHTLVMDTPKADINERGLIRWNDENYDIVAVRPSLNVLSIALRRRTRDHAAEDGDIPHIRPEESEEPIEGETGDTGETGEENGPGGPGSGPGESTEPNENGGPGSEEPNEGDGE